jgi:hypothetical protein
MTGTAGPAAASANCEPVCDEEGKPKGGGSFHGYGVLLRVSSEGSAKLVGARGKCPGCAWDTTPACWPNRPGDPNGDVLCQRAVNCTRGRGGILTQVWFRPNEATIWRQMDTFCQTADDRFLTPEQLVPDLRQYFVAAAPDFSVAMQPAGRTLINFDTIFYADYARSVAAAGRPVLDKTVNVLGFAVRIVAEPSWTWSFEAGATKSYDTPGDPYPAKTITYRYERPGARTVTVQASWKGEFYVEGDGPYDIAQPVTQSRSTTVTAVSARSQLVEGTGGG